MKGISAVVAAILVLLITVALITALYIWLASNTEQTTQTGTEQAERFTERAQISFSKAGVNNDTIYIRNSGPVDLTFGGTSSGYVLINNRYVNVSYSAISPGEIGKVKILDYFNRSITNTISALYLGAVATYILGPQPIGPCTPSWSCTDWSSCLGGTQTRICIDQNSCGTDQGKPPDSQTCADTEAPSTPTNVTANYLSPYSMNISWSASTDNFGVTGYTVYRNGTVLGTAGGAMLSFLDSTPYSTLNYSYSVDAFDATNNHSQMSLPAYNATPEDYSSTILHWKFDEGSGASVYDSSGNGRNLFLSSGTTWASGLKKYSARFSGSAYGYTTQHVVSLNALSVEIWIKTPADGESDFLIWKDDCYRESWRLMTMGNKAWALGSKTGANWDWNVQGTRDVKDNTWHQVVMTFNSTAGMKLYVDGSFEAQGTATGSFVRSSGATLIATTGFGCTNYGLVYSLVGDVDEVRIWNKTLSGSDISMLYNVLRQ